VLAAPSPARGRPVADFLLCLCCVCVFSGNSLRVAQPVYLIAWSGVIFLRAGALQASLSCCIHVYTSFLPACTVRPWLACGHNICTAARSDQVSSSHSVIVHICLALHVYFFLYMCVSGFAAITQVTNFWIYCHGYFIHFHTAGCCCYLLRFRNVE
jgi:hypothetical protein